MDGTSIRSRFRRTEKTIKLLDHLGRPITVVRPYVGQAIPGDVCSQRLFAQGSLQRIGQASGASLGEKAVLLVFIEPCRAGIMDSDSRQPKPGTRKEDMKDAALPSSPIPRRIFGRGPLVSLVL